MNPFDTQYHNLCKEILADGVRTENRTGIDTLSVFAPTPMKFDLRQGFPLITTKRVHFRSVVGELLWMLSGSTNVDELRNLYGVTIWDEWADKNGELGPVYGKQWRSWAGHDQIATIVKQLKDDPNNRGIILSGWNVPQLSLMALRPCHAFAQWSVRHDNTVDCHLYQRSADVFLGIPFNIAQYALLTTILAHVSGRVPGKLTHSIGDGHIYINHLDQVNLQLSRESYAPPRVSINPMKKTIDEIVPSDVYLDNYCSHPGIKGTVAV